MSIRRSLPAISNQIDQAAKSYYSKQRERVSKRKLLRDMGLSTQRVQTAGSSSKKSEETGTPSESSNGESSKKYYVSSGLGEGILNIPSTYRVTFGPNVPGSRHNMPSAEPTLTGFALRIYRDHTNNSLCGCIPNVYAFMEEGVNFVSLSRDGIEQTVSILMLGDTNTTQVDEVPF